MNGKTIRKRASIALAVTLVLSAFTVMQPIPAHAVADVTAFTVKPSSNIPGQIASYVFTFSVDENVSVEDVKLTAPAGYGVGAVTLGQQQGFRKDTAISVAGLVITVDQTRPVLFRDTQTRIIQIDGIVNPTTEGPHTWTIDLRDRNNVSIDTETLALTLKNIEIVGKPASAEGVVTTANDLTLDTLKVNGALTVGSLSTPTITLTGVTPTIGTDGGAQTLTIGDVADTVNVLGMFKVGASVTINGVTNTVTGSTTLSLAATTGELDITAAAANVDINAAGAITLDTTGASNDILISTAATDAGIAIRAGGAAADPGDDDVVITAGDDVEINAAASSIFLDPGNDDINEVTVTDNAFTVASLTPADGIVGSISITLDPADDTGGADGQADTISITLDAAEDADDIIIQTTGTAGDVNIISVDAISLGGGAANTINIGEAGADTINIGGADNDDIDIGTSGTEDIDIGTATSAVDIAGADITLTADDDIEIEATGGTAGISIRAGAAAAAPAVDTVKILGDDDVDIDGTDDVFVTAGDALDLDGVSSTLSTTTGDNTIESTGAGGSVLIQATAADTGVAIRAGGAAADPGDDDVVITAGDDVVINAAATSILLNAGGVDTEVEVSDARVTISNAFLNLGATTELTIAGGVITATKSYHTVDTQNDDAADDLDTINGGAEGDILVINAENDARTVVAKDGTGNLQLSADCTLDDTDDTLTLIYDGANWLGIACADNS